MERPESRFARAGQIPQSQRDKKAADTWKIDATRPNSFREWAVRIVAEMPIARMAYQSWKDPAGTEYQLDPLGRVLMFKDESAKADYIACLREVVQKRHWADDEIDLMTLHSIVLQEWAIDIIQQRLTDALFREEAPDLHMGFESAIESAKQGNEKALLALLHTFPEMQWVEAWMQKALHAKFRSSSTFARRYRDAIANEPAPDKDRAETRKRIWMLALRPQLVQAHNNREITARDLMMALSSTGVMEFGAIDPKSFGRWMSRTFADMKAEAQQPGEA